MPVLCGEMCVGDWEPTMGMADRRKSGVLLNNGAVPVDAAEDEIRLLRG